MLSLKKEEFALGYPVAALNVLRNNSSLHGNGNTGRRVTAGNNAG